MQSKNLKPKVIFVFGLLLCLTFSGCAVTSRSFEGTSETIHNTADASTEFSSSTSPRGEKNKQQASNEKAVRFCRDNLRQLRIDVARGRGEHLNALGAILGLKDRQLLNFAQLTQAEFNRIFSRPLTINTYGS